MSKKKLIAIIIGIAVVALINIFIINNFSLDNSKSSEVYLCLDIQSDRADKYNVYYSSTSDFSDEQTAVYDYANEGELAKVKFKISLDRYLRIDFGEKEGQTVISAATISKGNRDIDCMSLLNDKNNVVGTSNITDYCYKNQKFIVNAQSGDPFIVWYLNIEDINQQFARLNQRKSVIVSAIICGIIDLIAIIAILNVNKIIAVIKEINSDKKLILSLSKNDFKTRFAGSYLGIVWAFIQPVVTVLVYWFVFQVGLKSGRISDYPFILWLMSGLVPWFFFSEALNGGTNALIEYSYLVKKVVFKISILPIVKVISSIYVHLFFVVFIIGLCWIYGYTPDVYTLQIVYYMFCTFMLVLGLSYVTSAIVCFFKDLTQIIGIILQIGIWMTPIMWDTKILPSSLQMVFKLNPMYYVVDGFRDSLLGKTFFGDKIIWTLYFWVFTLITLCIGIKIFKKLKVHFADVI